jgi:hypothetical protein
MPSPRGRKRKRFSCNGSSSRSPRQIPPTRPSPQVARRPCGPRSRIRSDWPVCGKRRSNPFAPPSCPPRAPGEPRASAAGCASRSAARIWFDSPRARQPSGIACPRLSSPTKVIHRKQSPRRGESATIIPSQLFRSAPRSTVIGLAVPFQSFDQSNFSPPLCYFRARAMTTRRTTENEIRTRKYAEFLIANPRLEIDAIDRKQRTDPASNREEIAFFLSRFRAPAGPKPHPHRRHPAGSLVAMVTVISVPRPLFRPEPPARSVAASSRAGYNSRSQSSAR